MIKFNHTLQQEFSSANTSVNTHRLPAIYNLLNPTKLWGSVIFDYGVGKVQTLNHIARWGLENDVTILGYDKFNLPADYNRDMLKQSYKANILICSNVICTIKEDYIVQHIIDFIVMHNKPFFFKIYEGDKSGIGKPSKKDCYQRNMRTKDYLTYFNWGSSNPIIYKGYITTEAGKEYLK